MTQTRSRKPIVNQFIDFDDENENQWYHQHSSSPPSSLSVNNSFTHQSSSATMGSWGFDVNRSTNEQISSNNTNNEQQTIMKITKDSNEHFVDIPSSSQYFKLRTPTLTRHKNGNEFSAVDRLVLGPNRNRHIEETIQPQMISSTIENKIQTEQELLAWQNRMLDRGQRFNTQSPKLTTKRNENNSSRSSTRQIPTSIRPISSTSNITAENQHDHHESTIKSARVIKRYIELLYHLQSFYERITDQLYNGNNFLKTNQSIFTNHCRKIAKQLQNYKPIWEEKLADLQNLLKDIASSQISNIEIETTLLQRRSTLLNLLQTLSTQKELDNTHLSICSDIDLVLHEDKLAIQLQDELSTLLQHQSLLNDFTSLLQWNYQIYSSNEQNHVENALPLLREQITINDSYISHVSQQLTDLVTKLRSLEKYILSYTNTIPLIDDAIVPSINRTHWRPYDETDLESKRTKEFLSTNENLAKNRSISMSRFEEFDHNFDRNDIRLSTKNNNSQLNINNNNNNHSSARLATIKSAKRDHKLPLNSILKSSSNRKKDTEISNFEDEHKKKEDIKKMISKQNDNNNLPKRYDLQSIFVEEAKQKNRQRKHSSDKSYLKQQSIYPNA